MTVKLFVRTDLLWLNEAASHLMETPWELLEITEKSISWQSMKLLLSAADKRQARPSDTISLIKWQRQWHLNADPALEGKKSTNSSEKSKAVLLSKIQSAIGKKCKSSLSQEKKQKTKAASHAPPRPHTHFLTWTARKKLGLLIALWWSVISGLACLSWEAAFECSS